VKDFLTVHEAARQLKKSESTVRRFIRHKKLRATKLAGRFGVYIIDRGDMLQFLMNKVMEAEKKSSK
jgi:excisionase family DNA binding protein